MADRPLDPATLALHADSDLEAAPDVAPPIHVATTFDRSEPGGPVYSREPDVLTRRRLEAVLGTLDAGEAVAFSSGMAAVAAAVRTLAPARLSLPDEVYHGTRVWAEAEAAAGRVELADPEDLGQGDVWWIETPSNPKCLVSDIRALATAARARGVRTVVDSTFATPVIQRPLALGADVVMHSTTKGISGHSDAMGGVLVAADRDVAADLRAYRTREGSVPGSLEAWLTLRGVRTLVVRVERSSQTARRLVDALITLDLPVWYPFAPTQPGREIAERQMSLGGGVLSFEMASFDQAAAVMDRLRLFTVATSLGGVESLAEHRRTVNLRAPEGLIRLSVGLEAAGDLEEDLLQAVQGAF